MYPFFEVTTLGNGAKSFLMPWMPSSADNAFFSYQIAASFFEGSGSLTVDVFTKDRSDAGSQGTSFTTFSQIGTTGIYEKKCENLKELFRFKITVTPGTPSDPPVTQGAILRFLPPNWYATA